ncbi:transcriptional regulator [Cellulomonas hominis]|uniref:Putative NBD/HSP70 family sugar kinase n=1 Tax=Cellulomonas hominis TaxID=156981 RepID=A0A511F8P2_9CELL|nr:ROK family transcriptional regulator [Cellulomonas hominis]MBB5472414.1 putative NBD/HSP70 family sugar kinase [Cellulomonas hominis]GEL45649.1 transcriptional regulator [Cellulomonas hominis]
MNRREGRAVVAPRDSRALLLDALRRADALTQVELASATALSPGTVSAAVAALEAEGLVRVAATTRSGRRARSVSLATPGGVLAGVHCYLDEARVVLDLGDGVPVERTVPLPGGHRAERAVREARALLDDMLRATGTDPAAVAAVGVGLPAPVEVRTGRVAGSGVRSGWGPMVASPGLLAPAPGVPVVFDNDGNLGALAETRLGAGRGRGTVVHVALGEGVSGGIVVGGEVVHGRTGTAGELGHLTIDPDGPVCSCGNRGCLQVYAGSTAVLDLLLASHGPMSVADVLDRAADGDPGCRRVLSDVGRHLGTALASVCTVLDPDVLVVGGVLAAAGDLLLVPLREVLAERTAVTSGAVVDVVAGALGAAAPARGALLLARDAVLTGAGSTG